MPSTKQTSPVAPHPRQIRRIPLQMGNAPPRHSLRLTRTNSTKPQAVPASPNPTPAPTSTNKHWDVEAAKSAGAVKENFPQVASRLDQIELLPKRRHPLQKDDRTKGLKQLLSNRNHGNIEPSLDMPKPSSNENMVPEKPNPRPRLVRKVSRHPGASNRSSPGIRGRCQRNRHSPFASLQSRLAGNPPQH